jgi:hypothetical protein
VPVYEVNAMIRSGRKIKSKPADILRWHRIQTGIANR